MGKKVPMSFTWDSEYDADIIEKLLSVRNRHKYLRELIRNDTGIATDMEKTGKKVRTEKRKRGRIGRDLTGMQFGKWTVLGKDEEQTKPGRIMWHCRCECGTESNVIGAALIKGTSKQCVYCRTRKLRKCESEKKRVNGKYTPAYMSWEAIIHRCCYPNHRSYKDYGGRGITICEEWRNSFDAFYDYVTQLEHYGEEDMTIDRIDNDKGYQPGNVRWATRAEQNRHRRDREG